jgi:hypothetical protein
VGYNCAYLVGGLQACLAVSPKVVLVLPVAKQAENAEHALDQHTQNP